jgi:RHS repeat-associated protein
LWFCGADTIGASAHRNANAPLKRAAACAGEVVREDRTIGGVLYTTEFKYDLADNLVGMVYPSGRIVTYVRDALGRVTSVTTKTDAAPPAVDVATAITYMPFGPIASLVHGNALAATFTWDQDYRLSGIVTAQGGTAIQNLVYGYNLADNVTGITDNLAPARNQSFTLDNLQRLTAATGAYGAITYSYDAADNRLTRNLSGRPAETFTYGTTNNRLQSVATIGLPTRTFTHNSAGDITLDDRGSGNTVTIAIGADGRPQTITVAGTGATTISYKHNAFGERVSRVEGAATTHFHYDQDGRLIAESDGTGTVIREYIWLGTKPIGLVVGPAASATLYFVHADHLERPQKITDATQAIVWDGQFTPYGRTHAIAGAVQNPLRFPGQWADPAAAYFYNYLRDYDPTLARYLSVDPVGMWIAPNAFEYGFANPQSFIDRFGAQGSSARGGSVMPRPTVSNAIWRGLFERISARIAEIDPSARGPLSFRPPGPVEYTRADVVRLKQFLRELRERRECILPASPFGSRGGIPHQRTAAERIEELLARGHHLIGGGPTLPEEIVPIVGGGMRRPDITTIDPQGRIYRENIGDTINGGEPVARERRALGDLLRPTPGGNVRFTPIRR